jgi:hypothetical protein
MFSFQQSSLQLLNSFDNRTMKTKTQSEVQKATRTF